MDCETFNGHNELLFFVIPEMFRFGTLGCVLDIFYACNEGKISTHCKGMFLKDKNLMK